MNLIHLVMDALRLDPIRDRIRERTDRHPLRWTALTILLALLVGAGCGALVCGTDAAPPMQPGPTPTPHVIESLVEIPVEVTRVIESAVEIPVEVPVEVTRLVEIPVEVPVEVTRLVEVPVEVVVEVPVEATREVPMAADQITAAPPTPTPAPAANIIEAATRVPALESSPEPTLESGLELTPPEPALTLSFDPPRAPPGSRVLLQWSRDPRETVGDGALWWNGEYVSGWSLCELGLCGHPHIGAVEIPAHTYEPGPYLLGVGNGMGTTIVAVFEITAAGQQ